MKKRDEEKLKEDKEIQQILNEKEKLKEFKKEKEDENEKKEDKDNTKVINSINISFCDNKIKEKVKYNENQSDLVKNIDNKLNNSSVFNNNRNNNYIDKYNFTIKVIDYINKEENCK